MTEPVTAPVSLRTHILRWGIALAVCAGGLLIAREVILRVRMRAATRIILLDYSRFQGCLMGLPPPSEGGTPDRALAMAQGTGDPLWPHTCAQPLTRLEETTDEMALDEGSVRPLDDAVRAMDAALGEAVFWNEHVQQGEHRAPTWVASYVSLDRAMHAFAAQHHTTLLPPEAPRHPRTPRLASDPPPPAPLAALPGGTEADIVDATNTPRESAVLLRDSHARYSLCRWPIAPANSAIHCEQLRLPNIADPRYARFVPSETTAYLAVWGRAPYSMRGLVDMTSRQIALIAAGNPDGLRDYWVGPSHAMAFQVTASGPNVLVTEGRGSREVEMPPSADVLTEQRAIVGTPGGAALVWLDGRLRSRAYLRAVSLGLAADPPGRPLELASWREPRLTGMDRSIVPCSVPNGPAYFMAADTRGGFLFSTHDGAHIEHGPIVPIGVRRGLQMACDATGVSLVWPGDTPDTLAVLHCDEHSCIPGPSVPVVGHSSVQRVAGALLVADSGGTDHTVRVRRWVDAQPSEATFGPRVPSARDVQLAALDHDASLFVTANEGYAFISHDGGRTFEPAEIAQ